MGKKKKFSPRNGSKDMENRKLLSNGSQSDSDDNEDQIEDEINNYHSNKDKELFSKSSLSQEIDSSEDDGSDEEIMPFEEDSDDSEDNHLDGLNRFAVELKKDEMVSDLEDSDEDLLDSNAWGNTKNVFYNTDYVDKDFRNNKQKDDDLAEYEEEEALAIQKRLIDSISGSDFGIDLMVGDIEPKDVSNTNIIDEDIDDDQKRQTNLSNLTKRQKIDIIRKESPELESFIGEYKTHMTEIRDRLLPLIQIIKKQKTDIFSIKYIETRFHILINYCVNICFYMSLKSKRISLKEHPVINQILSFNKLLAEMNAIEEKNPNINKEVDSLLDKLKTGKQINLFGKRNKKQESIQCERNAKKVKFSDDLIVDELPKIEEELEYNEITKRGITYEIAKNKGLTPKRKKELKNPRVKHRMKFRKANIRRKGQVREPRKEINRYGGELSGIKANVVKSVRFK